MAKKLRGFFLLVALPEIIFVSLFFGVSIQICMYKLLLRVSEVQSLYAGILVIYVEVCSIFFSLKFLMTLQRLHQEAIE